MTNEALLDEVLTEYYDAYLSRFDDVAEHRFSLRHRLKMRKIFKLYEKNVQKLYHEPAAKQHEIGKVRFSRKTVLAIVAIVLLSVIAGCAVAYFVPESFRGIAHDDNTQLFAVNVEGAPDTIEYTYALSEIPQGFEMIETNVSDYDAYINYSNDSTGGYIVIYQYIKTKYSPHFNTEQATLSKFEIGEKEGVVLSTNDGNVSHYTVAWDNGDYIIEILTNYNEINAENLCRMLKVINL